MTRQRMSLRNPRMIEVPAQIPDHPDLLHHAPRRDILRRRKRNDFPEPQPAVRKSQHRRRALRRQPAIPEPRRQPPPNLDAGSEMRLERSHSEPDVSRELTRLLQLRSPEPKPMRIEMQPNALQHRIRLLRGQR